jgi:hypothetical protein
MTGTWISSAPALACSLLGASYSQGYQPWLSSSFTFSQCSSQSEEGLLPLPSLGDSATLGQERTLQCYPEMWCPRQLACVLCPFGAILSLPTSFSRCVRLTYFHV